jgi:hypothetical protein
VKYTNSQLNTIYSLIGFNAYLQFDPNIVSCITSTQAIADGGQQSDGTLQAKILQLCNSCAGSPLNTDTALQNANSIDQQLLNLTNLDWITQSSTGAKINPAMGDFLLRRQGRALIKQIAIILGLPKGIRSDYYGKSKIVPNAPLSSWPENEDF